MLSEHGYYKWDLFEGLRVHIGHDLPVFYNSFIEAVYSTHFSGIKSSGLPLAVC